MSNLMNEVSRTLLRGPRRPVSGIGTPAPNYCAHFSVMCSLFPFVVVVLVTLVAQMSPHMLPISHRVSTIVVSLVTLVGAICGAVGGHCYWQDVRREGLALSVVGVLGCGAWVVWYGDVLNATISLFR